MPGTRVLVTEMGAVYRLSETNWRKWLKDFKASGEKPDIRDSRYKADCLAYTLHDITDWDCSAVEWLDLGEN